MSDMLEGELDLGNTTEEWEAKDRAEVERAKAAPPYEDFGEGPEIGADFHSSE